MSRSAYQNLFAGKGRPVSTTPAADHPVRESLDVTKKFLEEEDDAPWFIVRLARYLPRSIQDPPHYHISIKGVEVVNLRINNNGITKMRFLRQGVTKFGCVLKVLPPNVSRQ